MTIQNKIYILTLTILSTVPPLWADSKDDFIAFIEARDNSIGSYDVQARQGHFDIALEHYDAFAEEIGQLEHMQIDDINLPRLVENVADKWGKSVTWMERRMLKQGERFKEISSSHQSTRTQIRVYDGQLYRAYSKHNGQLTLYPDIPPIAHVDFERLGITMKGVLGNCKLASWRESEEGFEATFSFTKDNSRIETQEYDSDFNIRRSCYHRDGKLARDSRWSFYNQVEGYSIPGLQIEMNLYKDRYSVYCYIVEDVKINCKLTDEDFAIGEMPPWTLVVDRRQKPYTVEQLMNYPHEILNDEVMLGDLTRPVATPSKPTESEFLPEPQNDIEQTEKTPPVTEGEQAAQADSPVDQEDPKIVGSQTGSKWKWLVILVLLVIFAGAGLVGVAKSRRRK